MRSVDTGNADCKKAQPFLDAYLSHELTAETRAQVSDHVERCPGCWADCRVREQMKRRLQLSVSRIEAPPGLKRRISRMVRGPVVSDFHDFVNGLE